MYQTINLQRQQLKMELQSSNKKLARKEEREARLEKQVQASRDKQQEYLNIIKQLKVEFLKVQEMKKAMAAAEQQEGTVGGYQLPSFGIQGGGGARRNRGYTIRGGGKNA